MVNFDVNDKYEIVLQSYLSDYDRKILSRLYQPLCGTNAIALYNTFWSELEVDKTISSLDKSHDILLNELNWNASDFLKYRMQLEALGLVRTLYRKNDNCYLYLLYAPKTPKEFFSYELFDALLRKKLGSKEYERVRTYFSLGHLDDSDCVDITQSFQDVYEIPTASYKYRDNSNIVGHESYIPTIDFDYNAFYIQLKDCYIRKDLITKELEQEISLLAATYNYSAVEMADLVIKSNDGDSINIDRLRKYARNGAKVAAEMIKPIEVTVETGNELLDRKISMFNSVKPLEFLTIKNNGHAPLERDARLIIDIARETGLPDPVINVLIDYCLVNNSNRLSKNYMQTIAGSLTRSNIADAYEAMTYLNKNGKKTKKVEDKVKKEIKEETTCEISDEEMMASLKALQELKKGRK